MKYLIFIFITSSLLACKATGQITSAQINNFLNDTAVRSGHVGISIYDPASNQYLYTHNAENNFLPSSNVKLFTLYAGMKYLGDSIIGLKYYSKNNAVIILPTADPTLLHPNYKQQNVFNFLQKQNAVILSATMCKDIWRAKQYGDGWSWNDYSDDYMAERSCFPIHNNMIAAQWVNNKMPTNNIFFNDITNHLTITPSFFKNLFEPVDSVIRMPYIAVERTLGQASFTIIAANEKFIAQDIPFKTSAYNSLAILQDSIGKLDTAKKVNFLYDKLTSYSNDLPTLKSIYSQASDSLLRPMMHNSDNFFAEQTLLMVSNEKLGFMSDELIIDTLLQTDFKDLPQKPRWQDGSGLSRYNLFSPNDFIFLLVKMQKEFGMDRIKRILPTAGQGTLRGYYESAKGNIYAKTGSMSNNVSLSGYIITKKKRLLIFSVHINAFSGSGRAGRKAIEKMILQIIENN